jgi:hypothetical protein
MTRLFGLNRIWAKRRTKQASSAQPAHKLQLLELRNLAAELQDLQAVIARIQKGEVARTDFAEYLHKSWEDIGQIITQLKGPPELHRPPRPRLPNGTEIEEVEEVDTIRHLHNLWEQMSMNPILLNPRGDFLPQVESHLLTMLDEQLANCLFLITKLTIWDHVTELLPMMRPGHYLPFHLVFDEEVPSQEQRVRLLNYLSLSPKRIMGGGLVDAANGLIYRYEENTLKRRSILALLILMLVVLTGLVVGLSWRPLLPWGAGPGTLTTLLVAWGSVLAGVATHAAIGSIKRAQARGGLPPVLAVGDIPLLLNALSGQIMLKLLMAFLGFCGLAFTSQGSEQVTVMTAFLLGYSLDSFIEIFGAGIAQRANAQAAALKQQLSLPNVG